MSRSHQLRLQGNQILQSATEDLAPVVWQPRVVKAIAMYQMAIEQALTNDERASAAKNCGIVSKKLAIFNEQKVIPMNRKLVMYYYKESIKNLQKAYSEGSSCKSSEWQEDIHEKLSSLIQDVLTYSKSEELGFARTKILAEILNVVSDCKCKGEIKLEISQTYFKAAVTALDKKNFHSALSYLKECYQPLEEAKVYGRRLRDDFIMTEAKVVEEDVFHQMCMAESMQAKFQGDDMLNKALLNYENLPMPLVWDVIDKYRSAIVLVKEQDVELEAIVRASIGKVYHKVLKMPMFGRKEYKLAINLAASLHPRTFNTTAWYQECTASLVDIQKDSVLEEDKRKEKVRKENMELIKEELKELDAHTQRASDLLEFIYKKFPPKNPKHVLSDTFADKMKKSLCLAIQHYHPDGINVETHGMKWKVLCEEITKRLTNKYETYKGVD